MINFYFAATLSERPMPKKKTSAANTAKKIQSTKAVKKTVQSPYSFKSFVDFANNNFALLFLFLVMFIAGFVIGSLWTEKQMLKANSDQKVVVKGANDPAAGAVPGGPSEETLKKVPKVNKDDHIRGKINAEVVFIEYSDFECPFCNRFHDSMKQIMNEYGNKVAWVYRHFPLGFHANAQKLAELSECVAKLGGNDKFWQFSDSFLSKVQTDKTISQIDNALNLVSEIGLNQAAVKACVDSGEMTEKVTKQTTSGSNAGISGTPGTIVVTKDGQYELVPGALPFEQLKAIIEKYL